MIIGWCCLDGRRGHDVAWELLARMYREETGEGLPRTERRERGKPYFPGNEWHFSLSHTKGHAFCVLAKENVGLDAEELDRHVNPKVAERILSESEYIQYENAPDQNRALLTFWVLKEAAAKLSGNGLEEVMQKSAFSLEDPRVRELAGCLMAVITESGCDNTMQIKEKYYAV